MREKTFRRAMLAVILLGLFSVAALVGCTWHLRANTSILSYIINRG